MSQPAADRPGVVVLPPVLYLVTLIVGLVLHWLVPMALPIPTVLRWIGGGLILVGLALAGAARFRFSKAGTNVNPMMPATALVTSGPFRFSRNPMYVALATTLVGIALLTRVGWLLILLPPVLAIMHWGVVVREERYLARTFGAEYDAYRARVRRYL